MSIDLMSKIWKDQSGRLNGTEKGILLKMADHASDSGHQIFPSYNTLALCTGFSRRTVLRTVAELIEKKYIILVKKGKIHTSNLYRINVKMIEEGIERSKKRGPVQKSVEKSTKLNGGSVRVTPGGSVNLTPGGSVRVTPKPSLRSTINKHHLIEGQPDDFCKNKLIAELIEIKVNMPTIKGWLNHYSVEFLEGTLRELKKTITKTGLPPSNLGAYMRKVLSMHAAKAALPS